ncbi:hypothetical protein Emag_003345 [Eimeria magna]
MGEERRIDTLARLSSFVSQVLTKGADEAAKEARETADGDYVCRQFELIYAEEPHTTHLAGSLKRALASTHVFREAASPSAVQQQLKPDLVAAAAASPRAATVAAAAVSRPSAPSAEVPTFLQPAEPPLRVLDSFGRGHGDDAGARFILGKTQHASSACTGGAAGTSGAAASGPASAAAAGAAAVAGAGGCFDLIAEGAAQEQQAAACGGSGERRGRGTKYCYEVVRCLGVGVSGQVYECLQRDVLRGMQPVRVVAAKLFRSTSAHICSALNELFVYHVLPTNKKGQPPFSAVTELLDFFVYRRHVCFVLELQQTDLYKLLELGDFKGLPLPVVQRIAVQIVGLLNAAAEARITHFDLKPENVLISFGSQCNSACVLGQPRDTATNRACFFPPASGFEFGPLGDDPMCYEADDDLQAASVAPKYEQLMKAWVKVIDYSASRLWTHRAFPRAIKKEEHESYVKDFVAATKGTTCYRIQTRYYGAPELLLGIPYYRVVDVWSMGCILAELVLGLPLFPAQAAAAAVTLVAAMLHSFSRHARCCYASQLLASASHFDLLRRITRLCGPVPTWILDNGSRVWKFYKRDAFLTPPQPLPAPRPDAEEAIQKHGQRDVSQLHPHMRQQQQQEEQQQQQQQQQQHAEQEPVCGLHPPSSSGGASPSRQGASECRLGGGGPPGFRSCLTSAGEEKRASLATAGWAPPQQQSSPCLVRGVCSRAVSEFRDGETGEEKAGRELGSRAAAALQLVRCFDRATEGVGSRAHSLWGSPFGNPASRLSCAADEAAAVWGRATQEDSSMGEDQQVEAENQDIKLSWRMLTIPEYEDKHKKIEPKTADHFAVREVRDVLRVRPENMKVPGSACPACTYLCRASAVTGNKAAAASGVRDKCSSNRADEECSRCRESRIREERLAEDFVDFLELSPHSQRSLLLATERSNKAAAKAFVRVALQRALVIDPLLRMTPEEAAAHPFILESTRTLTEEAFKGPPCQPWGETELPRVVREMQQQMRALVLEQQQQSNRQQLRQQQPAQVILFPGCCDSDAMMRPAHLTQEGGMCLESFFRGPVDLYTSPHVALGVAAASSSAAAAAPCVTTSSWQPHAARRNHLSERSAGFCQWSHAGECASLGQQLQQQQQQQLQALCGGDPFDGHRPFEDSSCEPTVFCEGGLVPSLLAGMPLDCVSRRDWGSSNAFEEAPFLHAASICHAADEASAAGAAPDMLSVGSPCAAASLPTHLAAGEAVSVFKTHMRALPQQAPSAAAAQWDEQQQRRQQRLLTQSPSQGHSALVAQQQHQQQLPPYFGLGVAAASGVAANAATAAVNVARDPASQPVSFAKSARRCQALPEQHQWGLWHQQQQLLEDSFIRGGFFPQASEGMTEAYSCFHAGAESRSSGHYGSYGELSSAQIEGGPCVTLDASLSMAEGGFSKGGVSYPAFPQDAFSPQQQQQQQQQRQKFGRETGSRCAGEPEALL